MLEAVQQAATETQHQAMMWGALGLAGANCAATGWLGLMVRDILSRVKHLEQGHMRFNGGHSQKPNEGG